MFNSILFLFFSEPWLIPLLIVVCIGTVALLVGLGFLVRQYYRAYKSGQMSPPEKGSNSKRPRSRTPPHHSRIVSSNTNYDESNATRICVNPRPESGTHTYRYDPYRGPPHYTIQTVETEKGRASRLSPRQISAPVNGLPEPSRILSMGADSVFYGDRPMSTV